MKRKLFLLFDNNRSRIVLKKIISVFTAISIFVTCYIVFCTTDNETKKIISAKQGNIEVICEYGKDANIPDDTTLSVREYGSYTKEYKDYFSKSNQAVGEQEISSARIFDISLIYDGKEIEPESSVDITVKSAKSLAENDENICIVHFKDDKETEVINVADVNENATKLNYRQSSFSVVSITTVQNSILKETSSLSTYDNANKWQIISGEYEGNTSDKKIDVQEHIRGQKNIIPTGVENEFYIYLSLDIDFENILTEYLINEGTAMVIQTSNDTDDSVAENWVNSQQLAEEAWNDKKSTSATPLYAEPTGKFDKPWTIVFKWKYNDEETKTFSVVRYTDRNTFNNGYLDMRFSPLDEKTATDKGVKNNYGWYQVGRAAKGDASSIVVDLDSSMVQKVLESLKDVQIGTMTDSMGNTIGGQAFGTGEGIIATEIVASAIKGKAVEENASITNDGKTVVWTPAVSSLKTSEANSGWFENVAELLYKIKYIPTIGSGLENGSTTLLDPKDTHVLTNASTSIAYTTTSTSGVQETDTLALTSPVIRSMLYEIKLKKVDQDNAPLEGATFEIYTKNGEAITIIDTVVSDENGLVDFKDLPAGTYYIKEKTAPSSYAKDENEYGPYVLCYTTSDYNTFATSKTSNALIGQGEKEEALLSTTTPIVIQNTKVLSYVLPETGGKGIWLYFGIGLILMISVSVLIFSSHKKQM